MTNDMLSQDEIDALLKHSDDDSDETYTIDHFISAIEQDALGEIGNISFGSASTALSTLLDQKVDITTPRLSTVRRESLADEFPKPHVAIHVNYTEGFKGVNLLVMKTEDAKIIADLMLGGDGSSPSELSDMHISAVQEAMNQMMGSAATSMSTVFSKRVDISPPGVDVFDPSEEDQHDIEDNHLIKVSFRLKIGQLIDSNIMQLIPVPFAKEMVQELMSGEEEQSPRTHKDEPISVEQESSTKANIQQEYVTAGQQSTDMEAEQLMMSQSQGPPPQPSGAMNQRATNVQSAQFTDFSQPQQKSGEVQNLNLLMDIPLEVTVELGRTKKLIKDILELSPGSILELDKLAGEPVDILVNNKLIAKGEVVVIEENFGVRVTDILSQWDRIQKLQ
ncbi:flagellar motor switch phosphatase FliY [Caldalkalibacillus salinus]|uniref:flagellar motor switch phosphatase FliY n=1 Tax=Caldalkalibacillus salinus TaxID=2803787 RepID=UPI001924F135|nr:flagellar motor switch phosphatase FliY [Caldalkalibacillus salinus]